MIEQESERVSCTAAVRHARSKFRVGIVPLWPHEGVNSGGSQMLVVTRFGRKVSITRLSMISCAVEAIWKSMHGASESKCAGAHRCIATSPGV